MQVNPMMDCPPLLFGPFAVVLGSLAFVIGLASWLAPDSRFVRALVFDVYPTEAEAGFVNRLFGLTQERAGSWSLLMGRLLNPIIGAGFIVFGAWATSAALQCGAKFPNLIGLIFPLEFRFWSWMPLVVLAFAALGLIYGRKGSVYRALGVCWGIVFGVVFSEITVAESEAQRAHWFAFGFGVGLLLSIVATVGLLLSVKEAES